MADYYPQAKQLSDYVERVIAHLATQIGIEQATMRVMEHLRVVLQAALEDDRYPRIQPSS